MFHCIRKCCFYKWKLTERGKSWLCLFEGAGFCCCAQTLCSWGKQGLLSRYSVWASHCGGVSCCRAWVPCAWASVVVVPRLDCPKACGLFLDQGSNPCPLHWQVDSQPLDHQGCPFVCVFLKIFGCAGSLFLVHGLFLAVAPGSLSLVAACRLSCSAAWGILLP